MLVRACRIVYQVEISLMMWLYSQVVERVWPEFEFDLVVGLGGGGELLVISFRGLF